ncbi:unnamed protein product [Pylaiella littoralis]
MSLDFGRTPADDQDPSDLRDIGDDGDDDDDGSRPELTRGQLLRIASGMLGLMFGWATKTVLTTPLFRNVYGVDPADLGYVWLAGPLSGLVVQPAVGVISDHRDGQGQRSFFFATGTVVMAASLVLLPAAGVVCRHLSGGGGGGGSSSRSRLGSGQQDQAGEEEEGEDAGAGTGLAVFALWSLDLAMNASLVAIRAIVADCAPPQQQPVANTVILISYGAGTLLGYGVGAMDLASRLGLPPGAFWRSCADFWLAALVLLACSVVATRQAFLLERSRTSVTKQGPSSSSSYSVLGRGEYFERRRPHHDQQGGRDSAAAAAAGIHSAAASASFLADSGSVVCGTGVVVISSRGHRCGHADGVTSESENEENDDEEEDEEEKEEEANGWRRAEPGKTRRRPAAAAAAAATATGEVADPQQPENDEFLRPSGGEDRGSTAGKLFDMALFYAVPNWLLPVCFLLFFSWVGWFAIIIFGSDWVGMNVFSGDPSAESGDQRRQAYEDGVSWASVGLAAQASSYSATVVTVMGCGPAIRLVRSAGFKGAFLTAVVIQSACLLLAAFLRPGVRARAFSLLIFAVLGVPLSLIESLPYMMIGIFSPREKHGQLLGKLNVWIVLAQLALTLCIHPIVEHSQNGDSSILLAGAMATAIGVVFVPVIGTGTAAPPPAPNSSLTSKAYRPGDESPLSPRRVLLE